MAAEDTLGLVGTAIAEKYTIEGVVGEGGFAVVYRATHSVWKRSVAVKVFKGLSHVAASERPKLIEEFIREGALLAELSERSAAICQARDVGMVTTPSGETLPYMVLEWLDGASLEEVIANEKSKAVPPRRLAEAVRLLTPAAEALALAHDRGIAHRDVKPANVFVLGDPRTDTATVKLLDFGIAKVVQDVQTRTGAFSKTSGVVTAFTPAYGAPEQFSRSHGSTGPWTDVFALALVLVELVTGKDGLRGDDFVQLAYASSNPGLRPTPRIHGVDFGDDIEAIFAKALAVNPNDRYPTARPFWNALMQAIQMAPLRQPSLTPQGGGAAFDMAQTAIAPPELVREITTREVAKTPSRRPLFLFLGIVAGCGAIALGISTFGRANKSGDEKSSTPAIGPESSATRTIVIPPATTKCPSGMIFINGGRFFMGSDEHLANEKPAHRITLSPFCIGEFEVTVAEYKSCSDVGNCARPSTNEWTDITPDQSKVFDPLCNIREPGARAKHPLNCVSWEMAEKYCATMGGRLPTEAEWEFAARGPTGQIYPWGDAEPSAKHVNACGRECVAWGKKHGQTYSAMYNDDDGFENTAPVGSFPQGKSPQGLSDVVGNVWEWVADSYGPYSSDEQNDPRGPAQGTEKVVRGGAWNGEKASWLRPTYRYKEEPKKRSYGIGFRCAATPK